ncbi:LysR family transcriptional regulator [Brenneria corticis]|uniref:LysR family transcriptional regulator n=1 Tax=Brenneria corticis TaxID=2173106 RepID=A0A2U1UB15_9GAMM|nr:LysR family transcriptional regulator [Brenneria sp. CFCC 11842]PWC18861.1 LysR family transcriptional regulator [Brenneria sp. CFCC 11842]
MNNFRNLDLNLLLTLDALLEEQNVTRAARRLHLSQPSVSIQLARLRDVFGDPLLLPGSRGMRPTARADALREPLRRALESLERAVSPSSPFDPGLAKHTWRVAASDYSELTILLPALNGLRIVAPGTRLAILEMTPSGIARRMADGEIDLTFHTREGSPSGLHQRELFAERYVLAGRVNHPKLKKGITVEQFSQLEQVIVSPDGGGFCGVTDNVLAAVGLTRRVVLSVPHFLFVLSVLASTDLVAMLPSRLMKDNPALQSVEPPVAVPGFEMSMLWHERAHRDPAHQWLREFISASI